MVLKMTISFGKLALLVDLSGSSVQYIPASASPATIR
jgi:hypothetical protein